MDNQVLCLRLFGNVYAVHVALNLVLLHNWFLAAVNRKWQAECSIMSERHGLGIFTKDAGSFKELFEEVRLMWRQCLFYRTIASGCLPPGICVGACVCV